MTALFRDGDRWSVFVVEDGVARLRAVEIGRRAGLATQVTSGLEAGAQVIVSPSDRVADGVAVVSRVAGE